MGTPDTAEPDVPVGSGGTSSGETGGAPAGTGGAPTTGGSGGGGIGGGTGGRASGGATQTGGSGQGGGGPATGGMMAATGGTGSGGRATGGAPATGGTPGTGGRGTGGAATGGAGTGGAATGGAATGGAATGGAATGGAGTGGAGTGGAGTGGAGTGGAAPTRLILSIDFVGGRTTTGGIPMADSETAGARPAAHWNSAAGAMGTLASLKLSDGTISAASVMWNAPAEAAMTMGTWALNYTDAPGDVRMMNGYLDPSWTAIPSNPLPLFTITGLPAAIAAGRYDVYVYTVGDAIDARSYQYGVGSLSQTVNQASPATTSPPSPYVYTSANSSMVGTHVVFSSITGASVSVTAKPVSGVRYRAPVNGVQIVWPSGS